MPSARPLLRAYGSLPEPLRARLRGGQPLAATAMPPAAREWLRRALREGFRHDQPPRSPEQLAGGDFELTVWQVERRVSRRDDEPTP
jgi:hypothetical protein